jgi:hypothetical protein
MSDLLKEEQRLYEIEQKKASKSGWKHWLTIAAIYAIAVSLSVLIGWAPNSNEAGASFMKISLSVVTGSLFLCKASNLFLWKKNKISP